LHLLLKFYSKQKF